MQYATVCHPELVTAPRSLICLVSKTYGCQVHFVYQGKFSCLGIHQLEANIGTKVAATAEARLHPGEDELTSRDSGGGLIATTHDS